jgi:hypothetical protein
MSQLTELAKEIGQKARLTPEEAIAALVRLVAEEGHGHRAYEAIRKFNPYFSEDLPRVSDPSHDGDL